MAHHLYILDSRSKVGTKLGLLGPTTLWDETVEAHAGRFNRFSVSSLAPLLSLNAFSLSASLGLAGLPYAGGAVGVASAA